MEYKLQDLIDIQKIQGLLDSLHEAFLPSIGIIDREGTILARAGSQNVCLSFHRRDAVAAQECLESDRLAGRLASESSSTVTYHCPHGLIDSATPIVIDGTHMGSVFIGQFLLEPPDVETFRKRARTYGFDENTYLEAIARVPVISQTDLERYTAFICTMTALLADMGLQHLRQFESEAELRASQQSYREMFDASWDALFVHDPVTGAILDVNQTMLDMFGYTREEVLRLTAHEISENVPPYSREEATRRIQAAVTEGPQLFEWRSRRKNGEVFWVEVSLRSCQLQGHHRILASARDITHRKEAQEKLATTQALLATAIEQSPAGILIADAPSLTVRVANPAAFTIRGSPTAQLTDISIAEHCKGWHITYPDGVTPYSAEDLPMGRAILKGEVSTNVETVVQTEQGEKRWLSINASPVRDANNRIIAGITVFHDITERKRAEQALVRSNHLLRAIIEASPLAVVSVDLDTNVVLWSPAAERIFGWTEQEIVGQRYPLAPDGRWDEVEAALAQAMQGASMSQQERLRRRKDGSLIPVSISTAAMRDEAGNVIGIMAIIADITKRKQAEEGLRFANTILRTQQETASDGILVVNEAARIISYNQRFVDMWELPPELMASGADEPVLQAVARKVANTPEFLARIEYLYQHRDVKTHEELALTNGATFERYTAPMWGIDGQYYGRVWYFHDITDRKRTEEALAESNRVLLTLMSNLPGMAYRCRNDRQWTHLLLSEGCRALTGYEPADLIQNRKLAYVDLVPPEYHQYLWDEVQAALAKREPFELRYPIRTADGKERWLWERGRGVFSPTGEVLFLEGFSSDITEWKQADEERTELLQRLNMAQKMEAVGQLAGGVAHDFNNLLTVILGNTDLLEKMLAGNPTLHEAASMIRDAAGQAVQITRSLLTFSRDLPIEKKSVQLQEVVRNTTRMLHHLMPDTVEIAIDAPDTPPLWVEADVTQLQQVLLNLAINARDAMQEGGTLRISTAAAETPPLDRLAGSPPSRAYARLSVSDTGTGIPPDVRPHLFEPFFSTKPRGQGTGLGLSVVHGIVENHDGRIEVESQPGAGSTFHVFLPMAHPKTGVTVEVAVRTGPSGRGEAILLAENNQFVRGTMASMLQSLGYRVIAAVDGRSLMEKWCADRDQIRLLIVDVDLPEKGGDDCLDALRAEGVSTPAILITGGRGRGGRTEDDPRTTVLRKPFGASDLGELVNRLIGSPNEAGHE